MRFWKDYPTVRILVIAVLFFASMAMLFIGFGMTGQLAGLGVMVLGVLLLTLALAVYNSPSRISGK